MKFFEPLTCWASVPIFKKNFSPITPLETLRFCTWYNTLIEYINFRSENRSRLPLSPSPKKNSKNGKFFQQIFEPCSGEKVLIFFILIHFTTFKYELVNKFGSYGNLNGLKSTAKVLRYKLFEWSKLSALTATNKPAASYTTSVVIHFNSCLLYKTARIVQYSSWTKNVPDVPMSTFVYSCITYARGPKREGVPIQG